MVWDVLSDLAHSPAWQADWQQVSFLTTRREGRATRFRCRDARNREIVIEITAWYNGLGYEYTLIDGSPFKSNVGRVRLQEIPEGTIVQWTFQCEGGRGVHRQIDKSIENSLKGLYRQVTTTAKDGGTGSKSAMRDGLSQEDRLHYQPRHVSTPPHISTTPTTSTPANAFDFDFPEPPIQAGDAQMFVPPAAPPSSRFDLAFEPPVADDDTRPRPAAVDAPFMPPAPSAVPMPANYAGEPDFLAELEAQLAPPPAIEQLLPPSFNFEPELIEAEAQADDLLPTAGSLSSAATLTETGMDTPIVGAAPILIAETEPALPVAEPGEDTAKSIWEIFGVQRPSDAPAEQTAPPAQAAHSFADDSPALPITAPLVIEPLIVPGDTEPLLELFAPTDSSPKPPPGLSEALAASHPLMVHNSTVPSTLPGLSTLTEPRRGGLRGRLRSRLVNIRRPK